eukprot:2390007-Amphidinium_carterae.1
MVVIGILRLVKKGSCSPCTVHKDSLKLYRPALPMACPFFARLEASLDMGSNFSKMLPLTLRNWSLLQLLNTTQQLTTKRRCDSREDTKSFT